jgi:hypothetical protein
MLARWRRWRRDRLLRRHAINDALWTQTLAGLSFASGLDADEQARLREQATLFLATKDVSAAGGLALTPGMRLSIAIQACMLVLELGLDYYDGWVEVVVYPDEFVPERSWTDESGVVHHGKVPHAGEAWLRGPVVLSWADVARAGDADGVNVVIHEFAHKLDMCNGDANGFPPLHREMDRRAWSEAFSAAYDDFCRLVARRRHTGIDPYAAESPAEFFAVLSEVFFETPALVMRNYPAVYAQLRAFYRQDPLARRAPADAVAAATA